MTTRELRQKLFEINDQEMTVRQLRALLFDVVEQDEKVDLLKLQRSMQKNKSKTAIDYGYDPRWDAN